jgi:hypothetical protein
MHADSTSLSVHAEALPPHAALTLGSLRQTCCCCCCCCHCRPALPRRAPLLAHSTAPPRLQQQSRAGEDISRMGRQASTAGAADGGQDTVVVAEQELQAQLEPLLLVVCDTYTCSAAMHLCCQPLACVLSQTCCCYLPIPMTVHWYQSSVRHCSLSPFTFQHAAAAAGSACHCHLPSAAPCAAGLHHCCLTPLVLEEHH